MFILGGFVDGQRSLSSERLGPADEEDEEDGATWESGPDMPEGKPSWRNSKCFLLNRACFGKIELNKAFFWQNQLNIENVKG